MPRVSNHNVEANALSVLCNMIFLLLYFRVGELGSKE